MEPTIRLCGEWSRIPTPTTPRPLEIRSLEPEGAEGDGDERPRDQQSEGECEPLARDIVQDAFDYWVKLTGNDPPAPVEPTWEQLSALRDVVAAGGPPFCDFAVWGNGDYRATRKPRLRGLRPDADGLWVPVELTGPPDFSTWSVACYAVYRTSVMMLRFLTSSVVDEYHGAISYFVKLYGPPRGTASCAPMSRHARSSGNDRDVLSLGPTTTARTMSTTRRGRGKRHFAT